MCFFFQAEDGIRVRLVTGVRTCALPIWLAAIPAAVSIIAISRPPNSVSRAFVSPGKTSLRSTTGLEEGGSDILLAQRSASPLLESNRAKSPRIADAEPSLSCTDYGSHLHG